MSAGAVGFKGAGIQTRGQWWVRGFAQPSRIFPGLLTSPSFSGSMRLLLAPAEFWQGAEDAITSLDIRRN